MNLVDSSCWLEYLAGTDRGDGVATLLEKPENLVVPSITIYEVFQKILLEKGEDPALVVAAHMRQGRVVDLDQDLALAAALVGKEHRLPLTDSVIYATAQRHRATLWTRDRHFEGLEGVRYWGEEE